MARPYRHHSNAVEWLLTEMVFGLIGGIFKGSWRFATGAHLDGKLRTDAGWIEPGSKALTPTGRASSWAFRPRLHRMGIRWGVTLVVLASLYGLAVAPTLTKVVWVAAAAAFFGWAGWRAWQAHQMKAHREKFIIPLGSAVGELLELASTKVSEIEQWLTFPLDFFSEKNRGAMRIAISRKRAYDDKVLKAVEQTIARKVGKSRDDLEASWHMVGSAPYLEVRMKERPPKLVKLEDFLPLIEGMEDNIVPLGIATGGKLIKLDLDTESPHIGFSCRSGVGKSVIGRFILAHQIRWGSQIVVLDAKGTSQNIFKGIRGVTYATSGKEFFDYLIELGDEMMRRFEIIKNTPAGEEPDVGPRIFLLFEEQNIGMAMVQDYWDQIKNDPEWKGRKNPAIRALFNISCAGREAKMNVMSVAQKFDNESVGFKTAIRTNFGIRIIRGENALWKMLAPEILPIPRQPKLKQRGRMHIILDGEAVEFQAVYCEPDEALDYALSGNLVTVPEQWVSGSEQPSDPVTGGIVTNQPIKLYGLMEAVKAGFVGAVADEKEQKTRYDWLRQRKSRDPKNFPKGTMVGNREKWSEEQIRGWYEENTLAAVEKEMTEE